MAKVSLQQHGFAYLHSNSKYSDDFMYNTHSLIVMYY